MRKLMMMAIATIIAVLISASRPDAAMGGEWCLIGLAWVAGQAMEDVDAAMKKKGRKSNG